MARICHGGITPCFLQKSNAEIHAHSHGNWRARGPRGESKNQPWKGFGSSTKLFAATNEDKSPRIGAIIEILFSKFLGAIMHSEKLTGRITRATADSLFTWNEFSHPSPLLFCGMANFSPCEMEWTYVLYFAEQIFSLWREVNIFIHVKSELSARGACNAVCH